MSADPPYLTVGTEVSAKYKGAFCEAKIRKCQKSVKCKVSPRDGGPQISVTDDSVQGELKISAPVKIRQPDSGQMIDGIIVRIIDSSIYTVVFDDGDVATLKRTQICLKGDKHYMESETLDRLPLTNPEHFSTPVNLLKKERRRKPGQHASPSGTISDESDADEEQSGVPRRISPRASKSNHDLIGKVISIETGDRKKMTPALIIRPANHELDMKQKGLLMVKSFRDNKISTVSDKHIKEFTKETAKSYPDDKFTRAAVEKALTYLNSRDLPASWKYEDLFGTQDTSKTTEVNQEGAGHISCESEADDDDEELCDRFLAQLYKFMDERSTPINKPAQLYNRDVNLYKLFKMVRKHGGYHKVSAADKKWKEVANKQGFSGMSAGTEMKLLYRRYLVPYEDFHKKMGDWQLFEGTKSQKKPVTGGRNVLPPKEREAQHAHSAVSSDKTPGKNASDKKPTSASKSKQDVQSEESQRRTPARQSSRKDEKLKTGDNSKTTESPRGSRGRPSAAKANIKVEKAAKLDLDKDDEKSPVVSKAKRGNSKAADDSIDNKQDTESVVSEDECSTIAVEVDYPPGTKLKVRYGRPRNTKIYDAKVMEVKMGDDKQLHYSVHYSGWNVRYDEVISSDRIVGAVGKCEKKKMEVYREGFGPGKNKKVKGSSQALTSASSTGSRTPEPPAVKTTTTKQAVSKSAPTTVSKSPASTSVSSASGPTARSTRSSNSDTVVNGGRPTRSRSTDSTLSSGLPMRKPRQRRDSKSTDKVDQDQDDMEEELSVVDQEKNKTEPVIAEIGADNSESAEVPLEVKSEADILKPEEPENTDRPVTPASENTNEEVEEKTPRRMSRKASKALNSVQPASPSTSVHSDHSVSRRSKRTESPVSQTRMSSEVRTRMFDVIDKVAGGEITADNKSEARLSPPLKKKKLDREDSSGSSSLCDQAFVKIEVLKHKKANQSNQSKTGEEQLSPKDDEMDVDENVEAMELPPLISGSHTDSKGGSSSPPTDDVSRPESEQSYNSDCSADKQQKQNEQQESTTLPASKTASNSVTTTKTEPTTAASQPPKVKSRPASTRRQQARRSPKHKPSAFEDDAATNQEVTQISSSSSIDNLSPAKLAKQNSGTVCRPPRQPKYNFRIEEELAEIIDQDTRITYLTDKLAEIRSLYGDVKANLASIERKRKRVKRNIGLGDVKAS